MQDKILHNLEQLFNETHAIIKGVTFEELIDRYIDENNKHYLNLGITTYLADEEPILLNELKTNTELNQYFEKAVLMEIDETLIISTFKTDILNGLDEIKEKLMAENKGLKNQGIFIEHDFETHAYLSGYTAANYPIILAPKDTDFYSDTNIFFGLGKIDYRLIWHDFLNLNEAIKENELDNYVIDTELYEALDKAIKLKTYVLLHKAIAEVGLAAFEEINIVKPLYIYANERCCETLSIYVFD